MEFMDRIKDKYEEKYKSGYGIKYPESHIIRIFNSVMQTELLPAKKNLNLLDFGCGVGTNGYYFNEMGIDVYGLDISPTAIAVCQERFEKDHYEVIVPGSTINRFNCKFDIILANQSLYYLTNTALAGLLSEMDQLLSDDGLVIFTMMGSKNYYYEKIDRITGSEDGLYKVDLGGRLEDETYINFIHDEEELIEKFGQFKKEIVGYYDFYMKEGSSLHYYYVGKKVKR